MTAPSPFDATGAQFAWDSTSLKLAYECPRKYQYKMIEGWQPARTSVHLEFGAAYATALETYHKLVAEGQSPEDATIEVVRNALIETWRYEHDESGAPIPESGAPVEWNHNTKSRYSLIRSIVWYLDQFGDDDSMQTVILSSGKAAVEHSFKIEVDNGYLFCGHIDRLVEYSGDVYVQDQKTTGFTITPRYFDQFKPDVQMSMYTFAGKAIFSAPVRGVVIDAAQIAVGFTRFERGWTPRAESELNEWYDMTLAQIESIRRMTHEQFFPMNPTACDKYGGCEFRRVCNKSPDVRPQFLKADFNPGKIWNPLRTR